MATVNNVPRDIQDSIREVLGRRVKLFIKRMVKYEVRTDKWENRVLVFSGCRLFVFVPKVPARLENNFNYLDIQALESKKVNQLSLTVDGKTYNFVTLEVETEEVNHMITHVATSLKHIFPGFSLERLIKKVEVLPPDRTKTMNDMMKSIESKEPGPCGGYTMMYACMCDYHSLPFRAEVEWDIDTIYLSQDSRELCLRDFDHLDGRDLVPIIGALEHNTWFTKLNANGVKLTTEAQNEVVKIMKRNAVIEELCLSNTGISPDLVLKLSTAILSNSTTQLSSIDLSKCPLDDKAIIHLIGSLGSLSRGLVKFDVSHTRITGRGLNKVAETLSQNPVVGSTLQVLCLSDNSTKGEDLQKLYNFLANPNTLTHIDLSGIDCTLELLCAALLRGCCPSIVHLNLARNVFSNKKTKDISVQPSWKQFFSSVYGLEYLDVSSCKLPPEALREMLLGIASNLHVTNLHIDLSSNDLQSQGAKVLESCIGNINSIRSLDISNNGLDQELSSLMDWVRQNKALKHIAIGRNFEHVKARSIAAVLDGIVQLIQDEESSLESLSLADSRLKSHLSTVLNSLGSNITLTELDISGNLMGDFGARILCKALQINTKLRSIMWDKNSTTYQGFEDIAEALETNYTLRKMPTPVHDASAALKHQADRTEAALQKIEALLQRNHSPQKYSSDQGFRMQQGFLVSSTQQMMDRLVVQNQDTINALSVGGSDSYKSDMDAASNFIKDADNSKQLLPRLQGIANKTLSATNPVYSCLNEMSENLRQVLEKEIKKTVEGMLECTSNQCSAIMSDKKVSEELEKGCGERSALPKDFTKHILDSVETEIFNKLSELNLAVAAHISDKVMDEVIESLSSSHKKLTNYLNKKKSEMLRKCKEGEKSGENNDAAKQDTKSTSNHLISVRNDSPTLPHWEWFFVQDYESYIKTQKEVAMEQETQQGSPIASRRQSKINRKNRPPTVINAEQVQKALQMHTSKSQDPVPPAETPNEPVEPLVAPKVTVTSDPDPVPMPRLKRKSRLLSLKEQSESEEVQTTAEVGSTDDLNKLTASVIKEEPEEPVIDSFGPLDTPTTVLKNDISKSRPRRPKMHESRRPGAAARPEVTTHTNDIKPDEGLDSFFSQPSVSTTVTAPTVEKPRAQSSKSPGDVKPKKEKGFLSAKEKSDSPKESQKDSQKEKKGGFANFFKKKKPTEDSVEPVEKDNQERKTSGSLFERGSKNRLSPFKKKSSKADIRQKSEDELDGSVNNTSTDSEPKVLESPPEKIVPEHQSKPEDTVEPPTETSEVSTTESIPEPEPEPEPKAEPMQALKPKPGAKKLGFGADMLAQIKQAQEKRKSQNLLDEKPPATSSDSQQSNGTSHSVKAPPANGKAQPPKAPPASSKPRPLPRNLKSESDETNAGEKRKSGDEDSDDEGKPPPILKPRPPKVSAKPTSSPRTSSRDSTTEEVQEDKDTSSLRQSVGDKIKMFASENNNTPPEVKKKTSSLPRDTSLPNMGTDESDEEKDGVSPGWKHRSMYSTLDSGNAEGSESSDKGSKSPGSGEDNSVNGAKKDEEKKDGIDNAESLTSSYTLLDNDEQNKPEEEVIMV